MTQHLNVSPNISRIRVSAATFILHSIVLHQPYKNKCLIAVTGLNLSTEKRAVGITERSFGMTPEESSIKLPYDWYYTTEEDEEYHKTFEGQLRREVAPGHDLYGVPVKLVARFDGTDDALFELLDGSGRVAAVHLTWAKHHERLPWPDTGIYPNLAAFIEYEKSRWV